MLWPFHPLGRKWDKSWNRFLISHLGSDQFPRVKVGVGQKPHPDADMVNWVLGTFTGPDRKAMEETISRAADAVTVLLQYGIDQAMSSYNG